MENSEMNGLEGRPIPMAVQPTEENVIAISTNTGVYLSNDYGNTFESLLADIPASSISFTKEEKLLVGAVAENLL
jgi:hypothetical protein